MRKRIWTLLLAAAVSAALIFSVIACTSTDSTENTEGEDEIEKEEDLMESLNLTSPVFEEGKNIPQKFTCDGQNISPEINWSGTPEGTKSFALICEDPDAPGRTFIHWVIFNIPENKTVLKEDVKKPLNWKAVLDREIIAQVKQVIWGHAHLRDRHTVIILRCMPWILSWVWKPVSIQRTLNRP